jgi:hypothetical protein
MHNIIRIHSTEEHVRDFRTWKHVDHLGEGGCWSDRHQAEAVQNDEMPFGPVSQCSDQCCSQGISPNELMEVTTA